MSGRAGAAKANFRRLRPPEFCQAAWGIAAGDCDGALSTTADSGGTGVLDLMSTAGSTIKQVTDVSGNGCPAPLRVGHPLFFVSR